MLKKILYLTPALLLPLLLGSPALADSAQTNSVSSHTGLFNRHHQRDPLTGTTSSSSTNWSGYAVTGANETYNSVSSSWIQPAVDCTAVPGNSYSSYWVGLDGFTSPTVEQIGTEADCVNHQARYSAWYEMYPSNPYEVGLKLRVNPGNRMSASVVYTPATTTTTVRHGRTYVSTTPANYKLTLANNSLGQSFSTTISPRQTYSRSSAEVVTEAPYSGGVLPLADFTVANYTSSLVNGSPMGSLPNLQDVIMENPAGMIATPSSFDPTNENFSVSWSK